MIWLEIIGMGKLEVGKLKLGHVIGLGEHIWFFLVGPELEVEATVGTLEVIGQFIIILGW